MKKLKFRWLWVVLADSVQWGAFKYKKEAQAYAIRIGGKVEGKKKLITDKY